MLNRQTFLLYVRNFIFGAEDSLVSTEGLLAGIASAGLERSNIVIAGVVLIFVEAFSMGVGSFLSQQTVEEYGKSGSISNRRSLKGGIIMFVSYFAAGFIPLLPYILLDASAAFEVSIIATLVALMFLGMISARTLGTPLWRSGLRMLTIGGIAVIMGIVVGVLFK